MLEQSEHLKLFEEADHGDPDETRYFSEIDIFKPDIELQEQENKYIEIIKNILNSDTINWTDIDFPNPNFENNSKLLEICQKLTKQINIDSADIFAALSYPLAKLSYPNNPYLSEAFYPGWVTSISLMRERMFEESEKIKDDKLVPRIVANLSEIFGFKLSVPVHMRHNPSVRIAYTLIDSGDSAYHTINMSKGTLVSAETLAVNGDQEQVESVYRMIILIHELCHAYTTEVLNPKLNTEANNNEPKALVGVIQEGISKMAESELLLTIIDTLRDKDPQLAEICFALLKHELSNKTDNHYQQGFEVFRRLRGSNFKEVLALLRKIGIEELSKYSTEDPQYSHFIQDPMGWLQKLPLHQLEVKS